MILNECVSKPWKPYLWILLKPKILGGLHEHFKYFFTTHSKIIDDNLKFFKTILHFYVTFFC
jgi:hypothetical protein